MAVGLARFIIGDICASAKRMEHFDILIVPFIHCL